MDLLQAPGAKATDPFFSGLYRIEIDKQGRRHYSGDHVILNSRKPLRQMPVRLS
jgi:hypothetical protein